MKEDEPFSSEKITTEGRRLLGTASIEISPSASIGKTALSEFEDSGRKFFIVSSPEHSINEVLDLSEFLIKNNIKAVPHMPAYRIKDQKDLRKIAARMRHIGIDEVFVIRGDGVRDGEYASSAQVLEDLAGMDTGLKKIGIAGHPEGVEGSSQEKLIDGIRKREEIAWQMGTSLYITTQMCFDPEIVSDYLILLRKNGIRIPVNVGISVSQTRERLYDIAKSCGVGNSRKKILKGYNGDSTYFPVEVVTGLMEYEGSNLVSGFHIYSFNNLSFLSSWLETKQVVVS